MGNSNLNGPGAFPLFLNSASADLSEWHDCSLGFLLSQMHFLRPYHYKVRVRSPGGWRSGQMGESTGSIPRFRSCLPCSSLRYWLREGLSRPCTSNGSGEGKLKEPSPESHGCCPLPLEQPQATPRLCAEGNTYCEQSSWG